MSFLDHHLQVGDALLGLTDLKALEHGSPKRRSSRFPATTKPSAKPLRRPTPTD
ncbi:hypothetical protein [Acidithiobacillus ferrivorans]|uniref:hypothetical protein n=1 Tax=Acidithiobacillus ferrivorans TaxID=160808 RepID=UPI000A4040BE|nr:hypothetical protein [Acidithiobacillus ferrivorans]